jgi:hypothetical protein
VVLPLAIVGGLIMWVIFKVWQNMRRPAYAVAVFVVLPYLAAAIENRLPVYDSFHSVSTTVEVQADPATVWRNAIQVPAIGPDEREFRWFHFFGVPWPSEAMLPDPGPGGVRFARYESMLRFEEPIVDWQPNRTFTFEIHVIEREQLPMPFNAIGGRAFDTLTGTFTIEPIDDGRVRLHLISEHRLSTRFNGYGSLWTRALMNDFHEYILGVIKRRAEAQFSGQAQTSAP